MNHNGKHILVHETQVDVRFFTRLFQLADIII